MNIDSYNSYFKLNFISLVFALSRALLLSVILSSNGGTPYHLGLLATCASISTIIGSYFAGKLIEKFSITNVLIINKFLMGITLLILTFMIYLDQKFIYSWILVSSLLIFFISIDLIARPMYIIKKYESVKIFTNIRKDSLIMGLSKLIGFGLAGYIVLKFYILIFILDFIMTMYFMYWYSKNKINKTIEKTINEDLPVFLLKKIHKNKSILFMFICELIIGFFIIPLSNQFLVISNYFHLNFSFILVTSAIGNIVVNLSYKKEPLNYLKFFSLIFILILLIYVSMGLIKNSSFSIVLVSIIGFAIGCIHTISLLVIRSSNHKEIKEFKNYASIMSLFFIGFSLSTASGSFLFGFLIHKYTLPNALFSFAILHSIIAISVVIYFKNKLHKNTDLQFQEDILKENKEEEVFN